jgi:hypothetical protein
VYNYTHCQKATEEKDGSDNWSSSIVFDNYLGTPKIKSIIATKKQVGGIMGL